MATYRGFTTLEHPHKFRLTDFALVKRDLLNHFNIRKGEKLMNPRFGCGIWDFLFEPLTEATRQSIIQEVAYVINYDPRVNADQITVTTFEQGIQIEMNLSLVGTSQVERMIVQFDQTSESAYGVY